MRKFAIALVTSAALALTLAPAQANAYADDAGKADGGFCWC